MASGDHMKDSKESLDKEENGHLPDHEEAQPVPPESKTDPEAQKGGPLQAWKWSVMFLCFYGFMVQLRPGEPFITPYLLSTKNFTSEEVSHLPGGNTGFNALGPDSISCCKLLMQIS